MPPTTCHNLVKLPYICHPIYFSCVLDVRSDCNFMDAGRHSLDQGCHISITALGLHQYSSAFALRSSSTHDKMCQDSVFVLNVL